jgi:hypothetical protein
MLNSRKQTTIFKLTHALIVAALFSLYSCMPQTSAPNIDANNSTGTPAPTTPTYQEPTFPIATTFIQEGATRSSTNIAIPVDFTDSFLVRGKTLSQYLRTIPTTTKFCLVGKYNFTAGSDKFLLMSAKPKSYTDLVNKTTEFYLQVEPSNDTANQNDCLSYNLTTNLFNTATSPSAFFSFSQLCATCTSTVTSSGLQLYFVNGEQVPTVPVSSLILTLSGSTTTTSNSCSESTACQARGFDCCLSSQCVNDSALKPGTMTLPGFAAAQEDVRLNPDRFVVYPQFYFVCETRPGESTGGTTGGSTIDPDYEAAVRIMELKQLHECINKVDGEFSYCTLKFTSASESIPGDFSPETSGFTDDINFSTVNTTLGTGDLVNNIVKITYAGQILYDQKNLIPLTAGTFSAAAATNANDELSTAQTVNITATLPTNAQDDNLYLTYKIDGSCEKVGSTLAKCTKTYIQTFSDNKSTMWHDSSKTFLLPEYADTSINASIILKVSGVVVPEDPATTWTKFQSPNRIVFAGPYTLYQNQNIEITYFVNSSFAANLLKSKTAAQEKVNTMCTCASNAKCNLKPIMNSENTAVVNYECSYATATSIEPPANQTVFVSNKNIAHRYFDTNGVSYDADDYGSALAQENHSNGKAFSYTNNDILKPNNVSQYVGFNEIYGSFAKSGTFVAKPSKMVQVKKDKFYDILVNSGVFSSCTTCGSDYYTALQKIFPQNFSGQGGGYTPDNYESRRENNASIYRADDLLYGRACFVPATMIPWTHVTATNPRDQRRARLAGQHFLFANGYNRDWYGFDYGSIIGSFDGVSWFSIGNQRRIKASTGKLFLAVNAYLGDLNVDSNFNVTVSETTAFSSAIPDHDTETDGAQCQKSHFCSNDNDCFRQLGYDYTCQNPSSVNTNWPLFDANGAEIIGTTYRSLTSIVGGSNGQTKRCMYRGKGAPCLSNLDLAPNAQNFSGSTVVGTLMCSPNSSCLPLTTPSRFNDSIARFANTPAAQNAAVASPTPTDTVAMGARVILRPYDYYGLKSLPSPASSSFSTNKVTAICVPGKDINGATDTYDLNAKHPSNRIDSSDKLYGVGPASASTNSIKSLNACPATDAAGITMQIYDLPLGDATLNKFTIAQNLSSNLLDLTLMRNQNIFSSTAGSQITTIGYQKNACLRAPGASCFSDMECAPSALIATKAKAANLSTVLNVAEAKFWEEDLVCGNPDFKMLSAGVKNPNFDVRKNSCCREFGKTFTTYTQTDTSTYKWCNGSGGIQVAGVNTAISTASRYSKVHAGYDKMTCDLNELTSKPFALSIASATGATDRMKQILGQFKTLDTVNQRTCCTQHWVRSFATENGGGHAFTKAKMQTVDKAIFKHVSWSVDDETTIVPAVGDEAFHCDTDQYLNQSCEVKSLLPAEEEKYLTFAGSLELVGIPQVAIKTPDQIFKLVSNTQTFITAGVPNVSSGSPLTDSEDKLVTLPVGGAGATADYSDSAGSYYSAASYFKLNLDSTNATKNSMKKVFSENEFNCCVPSGQEVPETTTASQCCTGFAANINGPKRCCLPDFTDLTVYLNRYVSSEGRGLPDTAYDLKTGYIKEPGQVQLMAAQKNLCCSGTTMIGVAINTLSIPINGGVYKPADTTTTSRRFNYRTDAVDNNPETGNVGSLFDAGVRWNNHVYCVPSGFNDN